MFDATLSFMTSAVVPWLVTGKALARMGNTGYSGQPTSALFEARDGRLVSLGVVQQHQFEDLARFVGRADWLSDPRFADPESRCQHAAAMREEVQREMHRRDAAQWEVEMSLAGIPCGMVREVGEAASLPHLGERGLRLPLRIPGLPQRESVEIVNAGFQMESEAPGVAEAPPRLGEHSVEIMQWLGYTSEEAVAVLAAASREP
jgi:crotonobetainyl-CoA:carnitine CoA-transferase CaiB-like acyl-CoA transferase